MLQYDGSGRGDVIRRIGAQNDQIHILRFLAGTLESEFRGRQSDIAGSPVFGGMPTSLIPLLASILSTKSGMCLNRSRSMSLVTSFSGTNLAVATIACVTSHARCPLDFRMLCSEYQAPIDGEYATGDKGCRIRGQPYIGLRNVFGFAHATQRRVGDHGLHNLLGHLLHHFGGNENPGAMAFTRILYFASSRDQVRANAITPALVAA